MATDLGEMVMNPIDTATSMAKGIGQLGYGAGSKVARNVLGYEGDRAGETTLDEAIRGIKGHYGLGQPGEFWKNLAEDPASYIGDVATVASGGAAAALKAKNLAKLANLPDSPAVPPAAEINLGQRTPEDIAFDDELDNLILFGTPPPNFLMDRPQNMNRPPEDIAVEAELDRIFGPDQDGVFDPDTEAYAALETAYDNQVPEPNEIDPFDDPDLFTAQYLNDVFPSILERAQRGDPLTDLEAFDVMTFERHGTDGVYDPTNTLDNWVRQRNAVYGAPPTDIEGAERMAFLTGADRTRGQNPVATVEGPYFEDDFGLGDVYEADADTPDYGYDNPNYGYVYDNPDYDEELDQFDTFSYGPLVQREEGIASMYSPTRRAVEQLRQSKFPDPVSLEKQLLAMGAKPDELESLLRRIDPSDTQGGGLNRDRLNQLADEAATEVQRFRRFDREYEEFHLAGATDPHVTTFEAPVGTPKIASQHFGAKKQGNTVLAHIRSAMFKTPGSESNNVYHLGEIQSDWAQFRAKLFSTNDEYLKAEAERDRLQEHVQNLLRTGYTPVSNLEDYRNSSAKLRNLEERLGATDTYGLRQYFDEDFPAPYIKTTRKWHQLGLKQALIEAVNSGAEYMSFSTGEQVKSYTGGKLEGQQKFYDEMTPRELDNILTKFSKETGVEKPVLEYQFIYGGDGSGHEVPAIRITDEFREAMKKYGLPSFASGGIVSLLNKK
jgi:hypothetical protein